MGIYRCIVSISANDGIVVLCYMDRLEHHSFDHLNLRGRGVEKNETANIQSSQVRYNRCSTRQTLALFRGQPWGDCRETEWSVCGSCFKRNQYTKGLFFYS